MFTPIPTTPSVTQNVPLWSRNKSYLASLIPHWSWPVKFKSTSEDEVTKYMPQSGQNVSNVGADQVCIDQGNDTGSLETGQIEVTNGDSLSFQDEIKAIAGENHTHNSSLSHMAENVVIKK